MTDSFTSDGTAQREGEAQAVEELQALIRQLRELGPAAPEEAVGHVTSCRLTSTGFLLVKDEKQNSELFIYLPPKLMTEVKREKKKPSPCPSTGLGSGSGRGFAPRPAHAAIVSDRHQRPAEAAGREDGGRGRTPAPPAGDDR